MLYVSLKFKWLIYIVLKIEIICVCNVNRLLKLLQKIQLCIIFMVIIYLYNYIII